MFPADQLGFSTLRLGAAGLAFGSSSGAWVEYVMLRRSLTRSIGQHGVARGLVLRLVLAAALAAMVGVVVQLSLPAWNPALTACFALLPFGLTYVGLALSLGLKIPIRISRQ